VNRRRGFATVAVAMLAFGARVADAQDERSYVVLVDRDMTPSSGATDLLTIERAVAALEDRWLPPARFDEATKLTRAAGIGYRFAKWFGLDLPQDHFVLVVGHEVFGHGARLREIGAAPITYHFDAPTPYGHGGAVTAVDSDVLVTRAEALGIDTAGIEAQNVMADRIGRQALAAGALPYRDAWMYLELRLDGLGYIRSVSPQSAEGHDVKAFLADVNDECDPPACTPLAASTLKRRALLMLADPMLAYAGCAWAFSYLVNGHTSSAVPTIALPHDVRYLPALRFEMTTYGTAVTTEHLFVHDRRLTVVSVSVGDTGRQHAWDVGIATTDVLRRTRLRADVAVNVWRQPSLDASPNAQAFMTGGLAAATVRIALGRANVVERAGVLVEGGYKSDGFARGERLHAGPILRVGMTFGR
jgi:hypothetical protein